MTDTLVTITNNGWSVHLQPQQISALIKAMKELLVLLDPRRSEDSWVGALTASMDEPLERPDNPALYLVLPDLSTNEVFAAELRALTEEELRRRKSARLVWLLERLSSFLEDGTSVNIAREEVWQWLKGLNDIRFALYASLQFIDETALEDIAPLGPMISSVPIGEATQVGQESKQVDRNSLEHLDSGGAFGGFTGERFAISNTIKTHTHGSDTSPDSPSKMVSNLGKHKTSVDIVSVEILYELLTEWQESLLSKMEAGQVHE